MRIFRIREKTVIKQDEVAFVCALATVVAGPDATDQAAPQLVRCDTIRLMGK